MLAEYVNPIALDAIQWKFYFIYIATLTAMIPTIWFLFPETKGRTLEEIAEVFDGPSALAQASRETKATDVQSVTAKDDE